MGSPFHGDLDEHPGSDLPPSTASSPVGTGDGEPAGVAVISPSSVLPSLDQRDWPEWARTGESNASGLEPRRAAADAVGFSRTFIGWSIWRETSTSRRAASSPGTATVVIIAACTSIVASLVTMWLSTPEGPLGREPVGTATVSYKLLDTIGSPQRAEVALPQPAAIELPQTARVALAQPAGVAVQQPAAVASPQPAAVALPRPAEVAVPQPAGIAALPVANDRDLREPAAPRARTASSTPNRSAAARTSRSSGTEAGVAATRPALVVITEPGGARVTINGLAYGTSPLTVPALPPGAKRVRVTKDGYEGEERIVGTDKARTGVTLRIELREADPGTRR